MIRNIAILFLFFALTNESIIIDFSPRTSKQSINATTTTSSTSTVSANTSDSASITDASNDSSDYFTIFWMTVVNFVFQLPYDILLVVCALGGIALSFKKLYLFLKSKCHRATNPPTASTTVNPSVVVDSSSRSNPLQQYCMTNGCHSTKYR